MAHVGCARRDRRRGRRARRAAGRAGRRAPAQPARARRPAARRAPRGRLRRRDQSRARRRAHARRPRRRSTSTSSPAAGDDLEALVDADARATTLAADDLGEPLDGARRTARRADSAARPGVAVQMLTSGTTGPPKRVDLTYDTLERVLVGAKHYETEPRDRAAAPHRCRDRQLAARAPRRPVPRAAVRQRRPLASRCSRSSTSTRGSTRCAATGPRPRASCPPRCAWCSKPTSIPPTSRASARSCRAPRRSPPTTPTRSPRSTASPCSSTYAATEFGGSVAGWNLADHQQFWATKRGSVGRAHAGCELRVVDADERRTARRRGRPPRGQGGPARRATSGSARPTSRASTPTASCGSSAAPTRRSSAAASRSGPTTCASRSSGTRRCAAPP